MTATPCGSSSRIDLRPRTLRFATLVSCVLALALAGGCASKPKARTPKPPKPWLNAKSLVLFPMTKAIPPQTPEMLASSMEQAWGTRLDVPEGSDLVRIEGAESYPHVGAMTIDLSDVSVPTKSKERKLKPRGAPVGAVHVDSLELVARPLLVQQAKLVIGMTASDAKFEIRRDKKGHPMLALAGAEDGRVSLEVSRKDIDRLLLQSARESAGKYGVSVDSTKLKLAMIDGKSLRVDLKVNLRVAAVLPAGLRFKARMDLDDQLNGKITRLSCEGDQLLGPLISGVINPALEKYEGKKRPLVGFAFGKMKLKDLQIDVEDGFKLEAAFGNVVPATHHAARAARGAAQAGSI